MRFELSPIQREVARLNAIENAGRAFEAIARGAIHESGLYARISARYANRILKAAEVKAQ